MIQLQDTSQGRKNTIHLLPSSFDFSHQVKKEAFLHLKNNNGYDVPLTIGIVFQIETSSEVFSQTVVRQPI